MKYEINFDKEMKEQVFMNIWTAFDRTEQCFKEHDLSRNIHNACGFSAQVEELKLFGADVDAHGIYNDGGFDRIGFARINEHVFVKNGEFNFSELSKALEEIAEDEAEDEAINARAEQEEKYDRFFEGQEE